jgi:hypothetical protein
MENCSICGGIILGRRKGAIYCSDACKTVSYRRRHYKVNPFTQDFEHTPEEKKALEQRFWARFAPKKS